MATGIQTSVRRGRSGISGRQQLPPQTNSWQKATQYFLQLETKTKLIIGGVTFALLLAIGGSFATVQSNQHVELYPLKMSSTDVSEVSQALITAQIEHELNPTKDGILLHPADKLAARARLADLSLPRHRPVVDESKKSSFRTSGEIKADERRRIESELAYTIQQMEGINDARVQLAAPEKVYWGDDNKSVTASVFLKVAERVDPKVVTGITALVAHSVPELTAENVTVLNNVGLELVEHSSTESLEEELVASKERRLQKKLLRALRMKYRDKVHAEVNVVLDFSKEEFRKYTPGGETDEGLVKDSLQLVHETLEGAVGDHGKSYDNKKEAVNFKYQENYHARLREAAEVQRLTASVMVDGADDEEIAGIIQTVSGTIGIDEGRGDAVYVDNDPWNHNIGAIWDQPVAAPPAVGQNLQANSATNYLGYAAAFLISCVVCGMLLIRRFKPVMNVEMGGQSQYHPHGIVDHNHTKDGAHGFDQNQTQYNGTRMEALENMVGQDSNKVAALLKSTWLSE